MTVLLTLRRSSPAPAVSTVSAARMLLASGTR